MNINKKEVLFASTLSIIITSYVSFINTCVNIELKSTFLQTWLRGWMVSFVLVTLSILFLAPIVKKWIYK